MCICRRLLLRTSRAALWAFVVSLSFLSAPSTLSDLNSECFSSPPPSLCLPRSASLEPFCHLWVVSRERMMMAKCLGPPIPMSLRRHFGGGAIVVRQFRRLHVRRGACTPKSEGMVSAICRDPRLASFGSLDGCWP